MTVQHTPSPRPARRGAWLALMVALLLLAAGLRFHRLDAQSLWNDEGASYAMTQRPASAIISNAAADIHPPGYYLLLKGWTALSGTSELALRALSAFASVITVALTGALGRRLYGRPAGIIAALLLALNTFAIYYAQEARMYALLGMWAAAGMLALVAWLRGPHRSAALQRVAPLLALALVNAAGLYTQYAYPLTMLAQGVIVLLWLARHYSNRALGRYIAANLLTLALFAPWAGEAIRQVTTWPNSGAGTPPAYLLSTVTFGLTVSAAPWWAVFGALALAAGGALWLISRRPLPEQRFEQALPAIWAALTLGAFALLRLQPDDMKQLVPAGSALALWLGAGAAGLWRDSCAAPRGVSAAATLAVGLALLNGIAPLVHNPAFQRDDYRAIAAAIMADPRPDDAIILNGPGQGEVWDYYYSGDAPVYPLPRGLGGDDAATAAEMEAILRDHRRIFALFWGEQERDPNSIVEGALDAGAFEVESRWVGAVRVVTYAVQVAAASAPTERLDLPFSAPAGEDLLNLQGYTLDRADSYTAGEVLTLTLFWQAEAPLSTGYKVFVHLYADPDAPPPAQHDSAPDWAPDETTIDRHGLLIPPDMPPGEYTLAVGVYDAGDPARRLTSPQGERVAIGAVTVR
ncbi:MAG: glycosyltransferase family 39 protein [Anaerolineae bacterium]|nr:glycosyltransferase family 39 protein [Anaerolineae bacterium]